MSSIGGLDPLADAYNLMGAQGLTNPNPYLEYTGQIPMAGYMGTPTDASGNPIASFGQAQQAHDAWNAANPAPTTPGTTLNSGPSGQWGAMYPGGPTIWQGGGGPQGHYVQTSAGGQVTGGAANGGPTMQGGQNIPAQYQFMPNAPQQQAAAPAAPQNPIDMRQAYLTALANPGHVTTPGAVMQPGASATGAPQPSVLQAFLSQHPGGGTAIPGGYSNQSFFNTLNQLQAQKGASA
jgi:hypothetical protein